MITEAFTLLPCPAHPVSTLDLEGCREHTIVRGDSAINAVARQIFSLLPDRAARGRFVAAQNSWIAFRHADCSSVSDLYEGGTLAPVEFASCTTERNTERLADLQSLAHDLRHR